MKFPKNRANVCVVMRYPCSQASMKAGVPVGVFADTDEADEYAGACSQEMQDKFGYGLFFFKVELTTYYAS